MEVAIVTVGDELLRGETKNDNATYLAAALTDRNVTVPRVTVLPDAIDEIAAVTNRYRAAYDAVVVTGGIGPTHDDRTMAGVAAAVGRELVDHAGAHAAVAEAGYDAADVLPKTTKLPAGARALTNPVGVAPGAVVESIYVLPGVPREMRGMFERIAEEFGGEALYTKTVTAAEPESALLDRIAAVRDRFDVTVGSYPGASVTLKLTGTDPDVVDAAAAYLADRVEEA